MTLLKEIVAELIGMFVAEKRLTVALLVVVAMAGWLVDFTRLDPLIGGIVLLFGSLILLIESVIRSTKAAGARAAAPTTASPPSAWSAR